MSNIEKEIRLKIANLDIEKIIKKTTPYKEKIHLVDITCGKYGFDSLKKLGYICRVRCKENTSKLEIKKYLDNNECQEKSIKIDDVKATLELLSLVDMTPYLVLDRLREVRKYQDLLIYIDEFNDIGCYLEIEFQDSSYDKAIDFAKELNLELNFCDKYGDIIKDKLQNDSEFQQEFKKNLSNTINNL